MTIVQAWSVATDVQVTGCDNEIHIYATTLGSSVEVLSLVNTLNQPVNTTIHLPSKLQGGGNFTFLIVGLNWGGPWEFKVAFKNGNQVVWQASPSSPIPTSADAPPGVAWTASLGFAVLPFHFPEGTLRPKA